MTHYPIGSMVRVLEAYTMRGAKVDGFEGFYTVVGYSDLHNLKLVRGNHPECDADDWEVIISTSRCIAVRL